MGKSKLGERIKTFREKLELSREDLADRSGLDLAFITSLEEEDVYPSLGPLIKIARSLGVRLGTFMDDEENVDPLIIRQMEREEELTMRPGIRRDAALSFHSLGKGKTDRHMEPFFIEIRPEEGEHKLSSHEGEEFIVVVSGKIKLLHGRNEHILGPGDSLYFNSIVPHHVGCEGDSPAEIYAVLYFPE
ncbi:MAG: helix-turn-helix domain-containing protein [Desulfovibrio sp.]|uniref:helix-turn-helix domain-containing protein n=1 Tax=Desulfovibrio sp. 7SRBS1 TaxID=3378064 RepID=UPI003B3E92C4